MNIHIIAVGSMKRGPERELFDDYAGRFRQLGRQIGFRGLTETEVASGGGLDAEAHRLLAKLTSGTRAIRLDEYGGAYKSEAFANHLSTWKDAGEGDLVFLIGGASGYGRAIEDAVPQTMAFGQATWPHRLVRVMLAEQLYRAVSILSGSPYHKA
ncbi:MAG: 23S rRNA (pseudouridine(1915)-N(3))-methyltransferase RlmH [Pseudomonadota bacterium]